MQFVATRLAPVDACLFCFSLSHCTHLRLIHANCLQKTKQTKCIRNKIFNLNNLTNFPVSPFFVQFFSIDFFSIFEKTNDSFSFSFYLFFYMKKKTSWWRSGKTLAQSTSWHLACCSQLRQSFCRWMVDSILCCGLVARSRRRHQQHGRSRVAHFLGKSRLSLMEHVRMVGSWEPSTSR